MKKWIAWMLVCALLFGLTACGTNTSDRAGRRQEQQETEGFPAETNFGETPDNGATPNEGVTSAVGNQGFADKILNLSPFSGGIAGVLFERGGITYTGLVNSKMQLIYSEAQSGIPFRAVQGLGYLWNTNLNGIAEVVNADGTVIASYDHEAYDSILGIGGGYVIVTKREANINTNQVYCAVLDRNGKQITGWIEAADYQVDQDTEVRYLGSKVFLIYNNGHAMFINSEKEKCYDTFYSLTFLNESAYYKVRKEQDYFFGGYAYFADTSAYGEDKIHRISPDFEDEVVLVAEKAFNNGPTVCYSPSFDLTEWYLIEGGKTRSTQYETGYDLGGDRLVLILGADHKPYYTVTDSNDNRRFEPVQGELDAFSAECFTLKTAENTYAVYTMDGKPYGKGTFSGDGFYFKSAFSEGVAVAQTAIGELHFIDPNGNILL